MKSTSEKLLEKYNTFSRRPTALDPAAQDLMFKSFDRTLGNWLPKNLDTAILDIGCGEGTLLFFLKEKGYRNLSGFDLSIENVNIAHQLSLGFVKQFNALDIVHFLPEKSFDVIFLMDLIEHIPKESAVDFLSNILTRLEPGGEMIIQTPNMGSIYGNYHRYNDLTHEFGLTEKSAMNLILACGININDINIHPAWNATTLLGYGREIYLRVIHWLCALGEGATRPKIPTKNLLIRIQKN
jgi:2-polyprenyl-3-methyl-5-hydroxy-6-metoxy-1,4-benzoquinol methylase